MTLRRIVAVSKDPEVQQLAQEYGQKVFGADDLADALDIVQDVNPDLILFDHRFGTDHIREFIRRTSGGFFRRNSPTEYTVQRIADRKKLNAERYTLNAKNTSAAAKNDTLGGDRFAAGAAPDPAALGSIQNPPLAGADKYSTNARTCASRTENAGTGVPIVVVECDDTLGGDRFAASAATLQGDRFAASAATDPATLGSIQNPPLAGTTELEFMQAGAYDYLKGKQDHAGFKRIISRIKNKSVSREPSAVARLAKPSRDRCLVTRATSDARRASESSRFFAEDLAFSVSMVGCSKATLDTLKMIKLVAASQCNPILIVGETGTGKELAAKAIHTIRHQNKPFVPVNCAALTANLLESELFGHVKGSFTGADREKTGLMELAESGTILLDEISEMPMNLQAKLLRVLQEKCFRKVGGVKNITCDATIISSSNRNLKSEVQANRFRRDLYYRLNICPITLAPLSSQERRQDIRLLAEYFLKTSTICPDKYGKITSLTELAVEALERHDWPGNVRELCNVIERAILLETTDKIGLNAIYIEPTEWSEVSNSPTPGLIKDFSLAKAERELIARALQKTGWQKTRAAALLGITRATLYAKVKQYNIEKDSRIADGPAKQEQNEISPPSLYQPVTAP